MNKDQYFVNQAINYLSWIDSKVRLSKTGNLNDIGILAENFFKDFLNLLYKDKKYNLITNSKPNEQGIDLRDDNLKVSVQVTSNTSSQKKKETIDSFFGEKEKFYKRYSHLIMLIVGYKAKNSKNNDNIFQQKYSEKFANELFKPEIRFEIIDLDDLLQYIRNFENDSSLERLEEIVLFLEKRLNHIIKKEMSEEAKQLKTLIGLIEHLSAYLDDDYEYKQEQEPNPVKKLSRFVDHKDFINERYKSLVGDYEMHLQEAESHVGIDTAKAMKIGKYLQSESDKILADNDGNPKKALSQIVQYFVSRVNNADATTIEYYVIEHLYRCNIFPNPS